MDCCALAGSRTGRAIWRATRACFRGDRLCDVSPARLSVIKALVVCDSSLSCYPDCPISCAAAVAIKAETGNVCFGSSRQFSLCRGTFASTPEAAAGADIEKQRALYREAGLFGSPKDVRIACGHEDNEDEAANTSRRDLALRLGCPQFLQRFPSGLTRLFPRAELVAGFFHRKNFIVRKYFPSIAFRRWAPVLYFHSKVARD